MIWRKWRWMEVLTLWMCWRGAAVGQNAICFTDVTRDSGIEFVHTDGRTGQRYFIETIGSGCAFVDYDNDGWLDIYLVNAGESPNKPDRDPGKGMNRLFRNHGDGTFTDVTEKAGVGDTGYGVGVCAGDYDNDGWTDLFLTNFGGTVLYRNNGDGTFSDATDRAGLRTTGWSAAAAFADIENDGDLDLYVVYYCDWDFSKNKICHEQGFEIYCGPEDYEGAPDRLFRNNGDGTFTDITQEAGIADLKGKGLGVLFFDGDNDGDQDIYVANDGTPNNLYRNNGNGTFEDIAWMAGADTDENGNPQGSMGIDAQDYDRNGLLDLITTNFQRQYNTIYHNDGEGFFTDASFVAGMGGSLPYVSWGTALFDADNDGWLDLFIANGHIQDNIGQFDNTTSYAQRNVLYRNMRDGKFLDITANAGDGLRLVKVSRGTAFGDFDNDGDIDILINNANDTPDLLRNDSEQGNWLTVRLVGAKSNRLGIGSRVRATLDGVTHLREVRSGGSYVSQNDFRIHLGLGAAETVSRLEIVWHNGTVDVLENVPANQILTVTEGQRRFSIGNRR